MTASLNLVLENSRVKQLPFRRTRALIDEIAIRKKAALRDGW